MARLGDAIDSAQACQVVGFQVVSVFRKRADAQYYVPKSTCQAARQSVFNSGRKIHCVRTTHLPIQLLSLQRRPNDSRGFVGYVCEYYHRQFLKTEIETQKESH